MTTIYTPTTMPRIFHPSKMLQETELLAMLISCKKLYMKLWTEAMNSEILEETKIPCRATYPSIETTTLCVLRCRASSSGSSAYFGMATISLLRQPVPSTSRSLTPEPPLAQVFFTCMGKSCLLVWERRSYQGVLWRKKHTTRLIMSKFKSEISNGLGFVLLQKTARSETSTVPSPQDVRVSWAHKDS